MAADAVTLVAPAVLAQEALTPAKPRPRLLGLVQARTSGAVMGFVVVAIIVAIADPGAAGRALSAHRTVPRRREGAAHLGLTAAPGAFRSAPTGSAATCCPG